MSKAIFDQIEAAVKAKGAELVKMGGAVFQLNVGNDKLCIDLKNGSGSTKHGDGDKPDVTLTMKEEDFVAMAAGKLDGMQAFMGGKLKIAGNMMLAQKLGPILESAR
uniref:Probable peroxisomal protein POX18 n=1 Tax=Pfiesteria piscicida TaxID=71001 RepID=A3E3G9_PFIPI|nr:probable peroxisomal protein POX18 [Pfiesteria piscicida]